jgi:hypothetical protein
VERGDEVSATEDQVVESQDQESGGGPAPEPEAPISERNNLLAKVRELRELSQGSHHLDLAFPGMNELVWARFRPFPVEKTERKAAEFQKLQGKQPILLKAACDQLIDACEQVLLLPERFEGDIGPEGENLIPIDEDAFPPIGFDSRLAETFGFSADKGRQVVVQMFPTEQAVIAMATRVGEWMQDVTKQTDTSLLGE